MANNKQLLRKGVVASAISSIALAILLPILGSIALVGAAYSIVIALIILASLLAVYGLSQLGRHYWLQHHHHNNNVLSVSLDQLNGKISLALKNNPEFKTFIDELKYFLQKINSEQQENPDTIKHFIYLIKVIDHANVTDYQLLFHLSYWFCVRASCCHQAPEDGITYENLDKAAIDAAKSFIEHANDKIIDSIEIPSNPIDRVSILHSNWSQTHNWSQLFDTIIKHGGDINILDACGNTPLLRYVAFHQIDRVRQLHEISKKYKKAIEINHHDDVRGNTALILACAKNHPDSIEMVKALLEIDGIDVNAYDHFGRTALWFAYVARNSEIIELLEAHGANRDLEDRYGRKPIDMIKDNLDIDFYNEYPVINDHNREYYNYHYHDNMSTNTIRQEKPWLLPGLDFDLNNEQEDRQEIQKELKKLNYDFFIARHLLGTQTTFQLINREGSYTLRPEDYCRSPMVAASYGAQELLQLYVACDLTKELKELLNSGDIDNIDALDPKYGNSALINAICLGRSECTNLLIAHGANVDVKLGAHGHTALMKFSCVGKYDHVVEELLTNGAQVDLSTIHGMTALLLATIYKNTELVKLLIRRNANPFKRYQGQANLSEQDYVNKTALEIAIANDHQELISILSEYEQTYQQENGKHPVLHLPSFNRETSAATIDLITPRQNRIRAPQA